MTAKGVYICLEGVDGSGKTSVFSRIRKRLILLGVRFSVASPMMPVPTSRVERLYNRYPELRQNRLFRSLLYAHRSRSAAISTDWSAQIILGDRSVITSYAVYWHLMLNNPRLAVMLVDMLESSIPAPDHVLFMNIQPEQALARLGRSRPILDVDESLHRSRQIRSAYFEIRGASFIRRLRRVTYHDIDASRPPEPVIEDVWNVLCGLCSELRNSKWR